MRPHTFFSTDVVRWADRARRGAFFRSDPLAPKPAMANWPRFRGGVERERESERERERESVPGWLSGGLPLFGFLATQVRSFKTCQCEWFRQREKWKRTWSESEDCESESSLDA